MEVPFGLLDLNKMCSWERCGGKMFSTALVYQLFYMAFDIK